MVVTKTVVCLANSRKLGGRCVAGCELLPAGPGPWIRPVSGRENEELSLYETRCTDRRTAQPGDILRMHFVAPRPRTYQQENWLIDPAAAWEKLGRFSWEELEQLGNDGGPLWVNGRHTSAGLNDCVLLQTAELLDSSLKLIRVNDLRLHVCTSQDASGTRKRRVQAWFGHAGAAYKVWVTDVEIEQTYAKFPEGDYDLGQSYLTISLGEPFNNRCYKLVAAILRKGK